MCPRTSIPAGAAHVDPKHLDFSVVPDSADIEPGGSAEFAVAFRPQMGAWLCCCRGGRGAGDQPPPTSPPPSPDSFFFLSELECFVAPKINRSFRLVDEESFTPPLCLVLRALGHTFRCGSMRRLRSPPPPAVSTPALPLGRSSAESFVASVETNIGGVSPEQTLRLPPCCLGDEVYATFQLWNRGEVPASFHFEPADAAARGSSRAGTAAGGGDADGGDASAFSVLPLCGVVPTRSFQLVTVRFRAAFARRYHFPVRLVLNDSQAGAIRIHVLGDGGTPRLTLPNDGLLYVRPTCLGVASSRACSLRNAGAVPLRFRWRVPEHLVGVLDVQARSGAGAACQPSPPSLQLPSPPSAACDGRRRRRRRGGPDRHLLALDARPRARGALLRRVLWDGRGRVGAAAHGRPPPPAAGRRRGAAAH